MRKEDWSLAKQALVEATKTLVAPSGIALVEEPCEGFPQDVPKVAVIGFAGDTMRGMLAVWADGALLGMTCPAGSDHDDWLCELSNLLLGRFKAALLRLGISVHLSTPMLIEGTNVSLDTYAVAPITHRFRGPRGETMYVVLDAAAEQTTRVGQAPADVAAQGDILMFDGADHA